MPTVSCYLSDEKVRRLKERALRRGVKPYRIMKEILEAGLGDDIEQPEGALEEGAGGTSGRSGQQVREVGEPDWRKVFRVPNEDAKPRRRKP